MISAQAAPELSDPDTLLYCAKVDLWSLGVVAFVLLTGEMPPKKLSFPKVVGSQASSFLRRLLEKDPSRRYSADQARHHEWFTTHVDDLATVTSAHVLAGLRKMETKRKLSALLKGRFSFSRKKSADDAQQVTPQRRRSSKPLSLSAWLVKNRLDVDLGGWCESLDDLLEFDDHLIFEFAAEQHPGYKKF